MARPVKEIKITGSLVNSCHKFMVIALAKITKHSQ
jgi:hypothetical protein